MRRRFWLIPLLCAAACSQPKLKVSYSESFDPGTYRLVGVLPFTDRKGRGRQIAEAVAAGLPKRGFAVVDPAALAGVVGRFKPDAELGVGITELTEIRQATKVQALLSGRVDPEGRMATIVMIDAELGDELMRADLFPRRNGRFAGAQEIAGQVLDLFGDAPARK